jgi:hypothetical protein
MKKKKKKTGESAECVRVVYRTCCLCAPRCTDGSGTGARRAKRAILQRESEKDFKILGCRV